MDGALKKRGRPIKQSARRETYRARVTAEEKRQLAKFLETLRSIPAPSE
jgi:hypothetical protein